MESEVENWEVGKLIKRRDEGFIKVNPEYQRGAVWDQKQMRLLIDSVLRGYQLPLIYLRRLVHKDDEDETLRIVHYDLIDGQQRINALRFFVAGKVVSGDKEIPFGKLYDPRKAEDLFPREFSDSAAVGSPPDWWANTEFKADWTQDQKEEFLNRKVPVAVLTECSNAQARDLFIRLQSGTDLSAQEKRDAWPGEVCKLVLEIGGKKGTNDAFPHKFFREAMKPKKTGDRGETRQLVAQLLTLFLAQREKGREHYVAINSKAIDDFYRRQGEIVESAAVKDFRKVLDKLARLFGDGKRQPLKAHDAIHLVLLTDELEQNYARAWESGLVAAFDSFADLVRVAGKLKAEDVHAGTDKNFFRVWDYGKKIKSGQNAVDIKARHEIYKEQMLEFIDTREKDPQRIFASAQKGAIYARAEKKCAGCGYEVAWDDAEFHHKDEHHKGGATSVENGALMCKKCHREHHRSGGNR